MVALSESSAALTWASVLTTLRSWPRGRRGIHPNECKDSFAENRPSPEGLELMSASEIERTLVRLAYEIVRKDTVGSQGWDS